MTLKDLIKKNKLDKETYISLHNKYNSRVFGGFVGDGTLTRYLDMEADELKKFSSTSSIYTVKLPTYEYNIGLDSIERSDAIRTKQQEARKNSKY